MQEDEGYIFYNYHFFFEDNKEEHFYIKLEANDLSFIETDDKPKPDWTRLEFNQCQNCKLDNKIHSHCPVAVNLIDIIPKFKDFKSYQKVLVKVETKERNYEKETPVQQGLSSLLGILMVTSGCPTMKILRPMVRFHLPFASLDETLYRVASFYLLAQYFRMKNKNSPDWEMHGLIEAYEEVQNVNVGMTDRLRSISEEDASANAVIVLDVFAKALPSYIFEELKDLEYLFTDFIKA